MDEMTASDFRTVAIASGLSRATLASRLGVKSRTIKDWITESREIPGGVSAAMQALAAEVAEDERRVAEGCKPREMRAAEFRRICKEMDFTQDELACYLDARSESVARWMSSRSSIPFGVAAEMRNLAARTYDV